MFTQSLKHVFTASGWEHVHTFNVESMCLRRRGENMFSLLGAQTHVFATGAGTCFHRNAVNICIRLRGVNMLPRRTS